MQNHHVDHVFADISHGRSRGAITCVCVCVCVFAAPGQDRRILSCSSTSLPSSTTAFLAGRFMRAFEEKPLCGFSGRCVRMPPTCTAWGSRASFSVLNPIFALPIHLRLQCSQTRRAMWWLGSAWLSRLASFVLLSGQRSGQPRFPTPCRLSRQADGCALSGPSAWANMSYPAVM